VSVFHSSTCLVFFKGFDDFSFLGGGVVPSSAFRLLLGYPLFGVGGLRCRSYLGGQGHTHGRAKCDAFAVCSKLKANFRTSSAVRAIVQCDKKPWNFRSIIVDKSGDELRILQMSAAHLNQIPVNERDPDREFRVEEQLLGEQKVDNPEEVHQLGAQIRNIVRNSDRSLDQSLDFGVGEPGRGAQAQLKLELGHDLAEIVGLPRVKGRQGARFVVVEALELAVVQAVSELLVNEEREASRASRESICEDGLIVLLWRFKENLVFLVRFRRDLRVKRRDRGSENQFSDELGQTSPEFCPRAAFGGELQPAGRGVHGSLDCSPSCCLPSSGGWSSRRQEGVGAGVDWRGREPTKRRGNSV